MVCHIRQGSAERGVTLPFPFIYRKNFTKSQKEDNDRIRKRFFQKMFPVENGYNGQVVFAELRSYEKDGKERDYMKCTHYENQIRIKAGEWQNRNFDSRVNHYMTCNTMCSNRYKSEDLFSYKNYVLDLDIHENIDPEIRLRRINKAARIIQGSFCTEEIPLPNAIVFTGRGLQLWWCIQQMSYTCTKAYQAFGRYLAGKAKEILDDGFTDPSCRKYGVSGKAMINIDKDSLGGSGGLFRVPLTYNTRAESYGDLLFLHENRLNVIEYVGKFVYPDHDQWEVNGETKRQTPNPRGPVAGTGGFQAPYDGDGSRGQQYQSFAATNAVREKFLFQLLESRLQNGTYGKTGYRNTMVFALYNCIVHTMGEGKAMEHVARMNRMFPVPLTDQELSGCIGRKRYTFTTAYLLEFLAVTEEELQTFDFRQNSGKKKNPGTRPYHFSTVEQRMDACELARAGLNKTEIASRTGLHPMTVTRILADNGIQTKLEEKAKLRQGRDRKIRKAIRSGMQNKAIVEKYGVSPSVVSQVKRKMRKEDAAKAGKKKEKEEERKRRKEERERKKEKDRQELEARKQQVARMYREGQPVRAIQRETRFSYVAIWEILTGAGIADPIHLRNMVRVKNIRKQIRKLIREGAGFRAVREAFADTCLSKEWLGETYAELLSVHTRKLQAARRKDRIQRGVLAGNALPVFA